MPRSVTTKPKQDWETPDWLFRKLDEEFHFTLDGAANEENSKCEWFIGEAEDARKVEWGKDEVVFFNPPYGRGGMLNGWLSHAVEQKEKGTVSVWVLPASSDTHWWHDYIMAGGAEIRYIDGRLHFSGTNRSAWMANVVVIFRPGQNEPFLGPTINARDK